MLTIVVLKLHYERSHLSHFTEDPNFIANCNLDLSKKLTLLYDFVMAQRLHCAKQYCLGRCYPGPWKVLRKATSGSYICLHQQEEMPSLKEVALDILPSV
jgi:hypothetical protein